jgi:HEAT repeat protein
MEMSWPRRASDYTVSLTELVKNQDAQVRIAALHGLRTVMGDSIIPVLVAASRDSNPEVVQAASMALGEHNTPEVAAALIALTQHSSSQVRVRAAQDLGQTNYRPESKSALVKMLVDKDPQVRAAAAAGLMRWMGADKAEDLLPLLIELLTDLADEVRAQVAGALRESRNPVIVQPLLDTLR